MKRFVASLIALTLLLSQTMFGLATDIAEVDEPLPGISETAERLKGMLEEIADDPEYGLTGNDFDQLYIGTPIQPYELTSTGLQLLNMEYYTIWNENDTIL